MEPYGGAGKVYIEWCAAMADSLNIGVPWVMCQQSDAPQPMVFNFFFFQKKKKHFLRKLMFDKLLPDQKNFLRKLMFDKLLTDQHV